jgi:hypothetical protein
VTLLGGFPPGGGGRDPRAWLTVLDGRFGGTVVQLGPGTDDCVLDGFTVTRGLGPATGGAGGITITASGATVRDCVVEHCGGCAVGGIRALFVDHPAAPKLIDVVVRGTWTTCPSGDWAGHAVWIAGGSRTSTPVVVDGGLFEGNAGNGLAGSGRIALRHFISRRNGNSGVELWGSSAPPTPVYNPVIFDCEASDNAFWGILAECGAHEVDSCTLTGNRLGGFFADVIFGPTEFRPTRLTARHLVIDEDAAPIDAGGCFWDPIVVDESLVRGGFALGTAIVDADPLFVSGAVTGHALAQVAAGQPIDSPAVDAATVTAASVGLDTGSTRSDGVPDAGLLDFGVHVGSDSGPGWGTMSSAFTIVRGTSARALSEVARDVPLPWTDAPGLLHDPTRPVLFYRVEWPLSPVYVMKEPVTDSLALSF